MAVFLNTIIVTSRLLVYFTINSPKSTTLSSIAGEAGDCMVPLASAHSRREVQGLISPRGTQNSKKLQVDAALPNKFTQTPTNSTPQESWCW